MKNLLNIFKSILNLPLLQPKTCANHQIKSFSPVTERDKRVKKISNYGNLRFCGLILCDLLPEKDSTSWLDEEGIYLSYFISLQLLEF